MKDNNNNELLSFINENNNLNKKEKKKKTITIFIINLCTIILLVGGGFGIKTILDQKKDYENATKLQNEVSNLYQNINKEEISIIENENQEDNKKETNNNFDKLLKENSDTIGWIKVKNTKIDLPVVQTKDNDFYLNHDFDKSYNSMGWVFGDYRNDFKNLDKNNIIYGHTYKDTIMFSSLQYVLEQNWLNNKENHIIEFDTIYQNLKWQIFSIYTIKKTSDYLKVDFENNEFIEFSNMLIERSIKNFNVEIYENDKILTLSTCHIDTKHRLVVHAKLITK